MAKKVKTSKKASGESEVKQKFKQNPALYIGSVVILILVVIAFVGGDLIAPAGNDFDLTFGYYDKVPIRWVPGNLLDQRRRELEQYYPDMMSNPWLASYIWEQAFFTAVEHNAILQVMKRSNYVIPEKTVDKRVAELDMFQEQLPNGTRRFSQVLYNRTPKTERQNIWRMMQEDLIKEVYLNDLRESLLLTEAEVEFIGKLASPERVFNLVSVSINDYPQEEFLSYAQENARLFDSLHLSKITIASSEREAQQILDSIKAGTITFEDAARNQSQDEFKDRGGDMGVRYICDIEDEITSPEGRSLVFNLRRGEISPVISITDTSMMQVRQVWVIYRLEDDIRKADFNDELVMEKVRSHLRNNNIGKMEDWAITQVQNFVSLANETDFDTAAYESGLSVRSMGPFPINYNGNEFFTSIQQIQNTGFTEQELSEMSRNENFWRIAFSTPLNTISEPFIQIAGSSNFSPRYAVVLLPIEEINTEESKSIDAASLYKSYGLYMITQQALQPYFLNHARMDNRFMETFEREFLRGE